MFYLNNLCRETECIFEPQHDKTNNVACAPSEDSDQPGLPPSLIILRCAFNGQLRTQCCFMQTVMTDQARQMPRLIWVFAGHTGHCVGFVIWWQFRNNFPYFSIKNVCCGRYSLESLYWIPTVCFCGELKKKSFHYHQILTLSYLYFCQFHFNNSKASI